MNCFNKVNIPKYKTIEKYEKKTRLKFDGYFDNHQSLF